jgi:hypothetical protein
MLDTPGPDEKGDRPQVTYLIVIIPYSIHVGVGARIDNAGHCGCDCQGDKFLMGFFLS